MALELADRGDRGLDLRVTLELGVDGPDRLLERGEIRAAGEHDVTTLAVALD